jgi:hypothetical protein
LDELVIGFVMFGLFSGKELVVGAVGHRPNLLPEAVREDVAARQARALAEIEKIARIIGYRRFLLLSALAEGSDRYAAKAALDLRWALECPLPFSVKHYEDDFADKDSVKEFRTLKKHARKVIPNPQHDANADAGYNAVGSTIAAGAAVLVAVWNGAPPKGRGGTAHVAALALAQGKSVLWIPVGAGAEAKLVLPDKSDRPAKDVAKLTKALKGAFPIIPAPESLRNALAVKPG